MWNTTLRAWWKQWNSLSCQVLLATVPWNSQSWRSGQHKWPCWLWAVPYVLLWNVLCSLELRLPGFFCLFCKTWPKLRCWLIIVVIAGDEYSLCVWGGAGSVSPVLNWKRTLGFHFGCFLWETIISEHNLHEFQLPKWILLFCDTFLWCRLYCAFNLPLFPAPFPVLQTNKPQIKGRFIFFNAFFIIPGEVKTLMIQLLRGVKHLHDNWILHRDLKTSNLLLSHSGILKVRIREKKWRKSGQILCCRITELQLCQKFCARPSWHWWWMSSAGNVAYFPFRLEILD